MRRVVGVKSVGAALLGDVDVGVGGLDEIFKDLQFALEKVDGAPLSGYFGIPALDDLIASRSRQQPQPVSNNDNTSNSARSPRTKSNDLPILELLSPPSKSHPSPAGKTSLVYLITALAILPPTLFSIPIGGNNAAILILDPLGHFHVNRLAGIMAAHIKARIQASPNEPNTKPKTPLLTPQQEASIKSCIQHALTHVHIFRPQSWTSLLQTLETLPTYLFSPHRHRSIDKKIHALVLEDLDSYYHSMKTSTTSENTDTASASTTTSPSAQLQSYLHRLSTLLSCPVILTGHSASSLFYRPRIAYDWPPGTPLTRLAVRRLKVTAFAPGMSVEDAERDRAKRWEVVQRKKFECFGVGGKGEGFVFSVKGREGVEIEDDGEK